MILSDTSTNTIYLYAKRQFTTVLLPLFLSVVHYLLLDIFLFACYVDDTKYYCRSFHPEMLIF